MSSTGSPDDLKVAGLFSYPLKGGRVVSHASASVLTSGLQHDRQWMLVDVRHTPARFVTQRECPLMATIEVRTQSDGSLRLSATGRGSVVAPLPPASALIKVQVWSHETIALDAGDDAAHWCAAVLGFDKRSLRLVRFNEALRRDCNKKYAGDSGAHTFFADGYPLLVANSASLADLQNRIGGDAGAAIAMNRFRANILVDGLSAWDEDFVDTLQIGPVTLKLVKPCVRCQVTTTDQLTGSVDSEEPLNTLAKFRNDPAFGGVTFGWNAVVISEGTLALGDPVVADYRF
jgi:uncharacterized protein